MQFKQFLTELNAKKKSLQYIEDLPLDQFIESVDNIESFYASEKMDGVALRFGLDEESNLYTSRAGKGNDKKIYNADDWGISGASDVFRAAHLVLTKYNDDIQSVLFPGDAIDIEILDGKQPNSIIYGKDDLSYLILLSPVEQDIKDRFSALFTILENKTVSITTSRRYSSDGINISEKQKLSNWKILPVQRIVLSSQSDNVSKTLSDLSDFIGRENETMKISNSDIYKKRSAGNDKSIIISVKDEVNKLKSIVVDALIEEFINNTKPQLQIDKVENALESIEGIVLSDPDNKLSFKLVDKNMFAKTNRFYYRIRELIKTNARSDNPALPIESRGGIFGNAKMRIAGLFNISGFTNTRNQKKILNRNLGITKSDTIDNFVQNLTNSDFRAIKKKTAAIFRNTEVELKKSLERFMDDKDSYELLLDNDLVVKYNNEITNRTLLVYAETMQQSIDLANKVDNVKNFNELIDVLYGQKVSKINE